MSEILLLIKLLQEERRFMYLKTLLMKLLSYNSIKNVNSRLLIYQFEGFFFYVRCCVAGFWIIVIKMS